jgi:hypothetical protein
MGLKGIAFTAVLMAAFGLGRHAIAVDGGPAPGLDSLSGMPEDLKGAKRSPKMAFYDGDGKQVSEAEFVRAYRPGVRLAISYSNPKGSVPRQLTEARMMFDEIAADSVVPISSLQPEQFWNFFVRKGYDKASLWDTDGKPMAAGDFPEKHAKSHGFNYTIARVKGTKELAVRLQLVPPPKDVRKGLRSSSSSR